MIAANKTDVLSPEETEDILKKLRAEFETESTKVFPISAVSGAGIKELLYYVQSVLDKLPKETFVFEPEYDPDLELITEDLPFTVEYDAKEKAYIAEGPKIEKMLGYTNLESEKGFAFFQKFIKESGIQDALIEAGISDGDTVRMYGWTFEFYKE